MILFLQLRLIYTIITDVLKCSVCSQNNDQKLLGYFIHPKGKVIVVCECNSRIRIYCSIKIKHNSTASIFRIKQFGSL